MGICRLCVVAFEVFGHNSTMHACTFNIINSFVENRVLTIEYLSIRSTKVYYGFERNINAQLPWNTEFDSY